MTLPNEGETTQATGESQTTETILTAEQSEETAGQPEDGSAEGVKAGDGEQEAEAKGDGEAAPEAPTYDYEVPAEMGEVVNQEAVDEFKSWAQKHNLSDEAAREAWQMGLDLQGGIAAQLQEKLTQQADEWMEQTKADEEIGGAKLAQTAAVAKKAMARYATPELKKVLNDSGIGNHPEMVRLFYKIGKSISEDSIVPAQSNSAAEKSTAEVLYG